MRIRFSILIPLIAFLFSLSSCDDGSKAASKNGEKQLDSISYYTNLIQSDSTNYRYYARRAALYLEKEQVNAAFRDLSQALDRNATDASLYIMLADIYFIIGKTDNSITALKKALEINPSYEMAYLQLAKTYLILREYELSEQYAEKLKSINIDNPEAYYLMGIGFMERADTARAIVELQLAATLDTLHYAALMQLASIYDSKEDTIAIAYYKKALKAKPMDESALFYLAVAYQDNKRFVESIKLFDTLCATYATSRRPYYHLGYIYLVEFQQYDKAEAAFIKAIEIDPSYVEAVYNLGRTYEAMGNFNAARVQYRQALQLLPNYPLAVQGLNRIVQTN